jgi:hypothetical protein
MNWYRIARHCHRPTLTGGLCLKGNRPEQNRKIFRRGVGWQDVCKFPNEKVEPRPYVGGIGINNHPLIFPAGGNPMLKCISGYSTRTPSDPIGATSSERNPNRRKPKFVGGGVAGGWLFGSRAVCRFIGGCNGCKLARVDNLPRSVPSHPIGQSVLIITHFVILHSDS